MCRASCAAHHVPRAAAQPDAGAESGDRRLRPGAVGPDAAQAAAPTIVLQLSAQDRHAPASLASC
ncbi:hypothetical protein ThrDRAFT_02790 [Frankia casuarinae]|jgi:hypothetical protein|nr:hypothetical protein ThrDRAFT_02790 [Frankia casuarinae]KDA44832.1 hypothetical protein BMG523Draft_00355 [Frankia sp. BMG5.23]